ncbi:hypothetical protein BDR03DRAFT_967566 [Suillus americanus]|nr:hypothetical protein BDR03DRAFT_967566 [Suillus americanus]
MCKLPLSPQWHGRGNPETRFICQSGKVRSQVLRRKSSYVFCYWHPFGSCIDIILLKFRSVYPLIPLPLMCPHETRMPDRAGLLGAEPVMSVPVHTSLWACLEFNRQGTDTDNLYARAGNLDLGATEDTLSFEPEGDNDQAIAEAHRTSTIPTH